MHWDSDGLRTRTAMVSLALEVRTEGIDISTSRRFLLLLWSQILVFKKACAKRST